MENKDLSPLKDYAVQLTAQVIDENIKCRREPSLARMDVMIPILIEDFKGVLRKLCREGMLSWHKDLNGKIMFEFTQPK